MPEDKWVFHGCRWWLLLIMGDLGGPCIRGSLTIIAQDSSDGGIEIFQDGHVATDAADRRGAFILDLSTQREGQPHLYHLFVDQMTKGQHFSSLDMGHFHHFHHFHCLFLAESTSWVCGIPRWISPCEIARGGPHCEWWRVLDQGNLHNPS